MTTPLVRPLLPLRGILVFEGVDLAVVSLVAGPVSSRGIEVEAKPGGVLVLRRCGTGRFALNFSSGREGWLPTRVYDLGQRVCSEKGTAQGASR